MWGLIDLCFDLRVVKRVSELMFDSEGVFGRVWLVGGFNGNRTVVGSSDEHYSSISGSVSLPVNSGHVCAMVLVVRRRPRARLAALLPPLQY